MIRIQYAMTRSILDRLKYFLDAFCVILYNKIYAKRHFVLEPNILDQICQVIERKYKNFDRRSLAVSSVASFSSRKTELSPNLYRVTTSGSPFMILKTQNAPFLHDVKRMLCKEYISLKYANKLVSLSDYVPEPVYFGRIGDKAILMESFLSGIRISDLIHSATPEQITSHFASASMLLAGLAKETIAQDSVFMQKYKEELSKFQLKFGPIFGNIMEYFTIKDVGPIWKCVKHGDFFISNVLVSERHEIIGLTDYEDFSKCGFPFEDLFHFIVSYLLALERIGKIKQLDADSFVGFIKDMISIYNQDIGLGQDQMDALFKYCWLVSINRHVSRYRQNQELALYRIKKIASKPQNLTDFVCQLLR